MNKRIYGVYRKGVLPDEIAQLLGPKLNSLLSLNPTIKIRARQGVHLGEHEDTQDVNTTEIFPLLGPKLDLMALEIKPEIEIVLGD